MSDKIDVLIRARATVEYSTTVQMDKGDYERLRKNVGDDEGEAAWEILDYLDPATDVICCEPEEITKFEMAIATEAE